MRSTRVAAMVALVTGLCLGVVVAFFPPVDAARNPSGTYSLPSGNPVVPGTKITATWANSTLSDVGAEITNSLDRQGRGSMTAPLKLTNGTSSAPGLTFSSETVSGLYRAGANDVRMQVNSNQIQQWTTTGSTFVRGLTVTNNQTNGVGISATGNGTGIGLAAYAGATATTAILGTGASGQPSYGLQGIGGGTEPGVYGAGELGSNSPGIAGQGRGTGAGLLGTGGAFGGSGAILTGGADGGVGLIASGNGTGPGIASTGGATNGAGGTFAGGADGGVGLAATGGGNGSPAGATLTGGLPNGVGLTATGAGTGRGATFTPGTAATGGAPTYAVTLASGHLQFSPAVNPTSTTGVTNTLTPKAVAKAWARVTTTGGGSTSVTVNDGLNVDSANASGSNLNIVMADDLTSTNCAAFIVPETVPVACSMNCISGSIAQAQCSGINFQADASSSFSVVVFGVQ